MNQLSGIEPVKAALRSGRGKLAQGEPPHEQTAVPFLAAASNPPSSAASVCRQSLAVGQTTDCTSCLTSSARRR
jgi:hypothetical protein